MKPERIAENFAIFDFTLSDDEMLRLSRLARRDGRMVSASVSLGWDDAPPR